MESPIEMDDVGVSPFSEISMWVLIQGDHLLFNGYSEKTSRNISKHQPTCVICVSKASAWLATHPLGFALFGFNKVQSLKADGKVRTSQIIQNSMSTSAFELETNSTVDVTQWLRSRLLRRKKKVL